MDTARPLLTEEPAYKALLQYFNGNGKKLSMAEMFQKDPGRFSKFRYHWPSSLQKVINFDAAKLLFIASQLPSFIKNTLISYCF